jgi:hypothetical protein
MALLNVLTYLYLIDAIVQPIHLLIGMFVFVAIIAGIVFFILLYLIRRTAKSIRRKNLRQCYSENISELAVCESSEDLELLLGQPETQQLLRLIGQDVFARRVLITELLKTVKNMSGSAADNVCWFYTQAGLEKDSLLRLQNGAWHIKARAIQELSGLRQHKHIPKIYRYTNNANELVRSEARTAVVKLTGFEGLRFLDIISYPLTEWEQLCLLHELSLHGNRSFAKLGDWLQSANYSVVEFALRLVEVYSLHHFFSNVTACLKHPSKAVRKKVIAALQQIFDAAAADALMEIFPEETTDVQLLILQLFKEYGTEKEQFFLLQQVVHPVQDIRVAAAKAFYYTQPDAERLLKQQVDATVYPWTVLLPQLKQEVAV